MGNNVSSSNIDNNDSASPSSPGVSRPTSASTERTHSLPSGYHNQIRQRHSHHHHHYQQQQQQQHYSGHSADRRHTSSLTSPPIAARRSSSRFRQALPNFVNNVSTAIGHKLSWSSSSGGGGHGNSKRRYHQKSSSFNPGGNYYQSCVKSGGKVEKRSRSKTREHCRLFRELVNDWRLSDLHCLVVEFEAALSLRELRRRADAARPIAASLKADFGRLYHEINTKIDQQKANDDSSADGFLLLDGCTFAVHRTFLSKRCSFFRRLFRNGNDTNNYYDGGWRPTIPVTFPNSMTPLNSSTFGLLLEYLYTGELTTKDDEDYRNLIQFNDERCQMTREGNGRCGLDDDRKWTTLEDDVAAMFKETNDGADALLIFTNSKHASQSANSSMDTEFDGTEETIMTLEDDPRTKRAPLLVVVEKQKAKCCQFKCHSVVLAARSPFFRAIIRKRRLQDEQRQNQDQNEVHRRSASSPFSPWRKPMTSGLLEIVLDESVIPRQYAPVLLHAMYTDVVDLSLVMRDCVASAASCLTEVQAIAAGKCQLSPIDEATEIYQIARFLEFDKLAQGCEDVIISYITLDSLAAIYSWSTESYGSAYVRRHCVDYLCQEFGRFCTTPLLFDMDETLLVEVLKSDYVQACELEILNAVIRWGEHQLVRRIEEREPNILVGTTHSISRKGVKRTDLSDEELKEILANLLPLIRVDYVLPANHTILENVISRGLISVPSVDLLAGSHTSGVLLPPAVAARRQHRKSLHSRHSPSALVRSCSSSATPSIDDVESGASNLEHKSRDHWSQPHRHSARPRLFLPYLEESRSLLEKRVADSPDQLSALINHHPPIGTVSDRHFIIHRSNSGTGSNRFPDALYMVDGVVDNGACYQSEDLVDTSEITVPPSATLHLLKERIDRILRTSTTVKRALACGCSYHKSNVLKQVRLRAVREFGLLDSTLAILDNYGCLTSTSSIDFGRPSFCSSAPLSPADDTDRDELQYVDSEMSALDDILLYSNTQSPTKRRFRSQPELSQCDLTGQLSTSMDWPDLMASSIDSDYPALSHNRRATSCVSTSSTAGNDWPLAAATGSDLSSNVNNACLSFSNQKEKSTLGSQEQLRQQFMDLTQQISDLVVVNEGGLATTENDKDERPSTSNSHQRQNTAV